jgi:hypothetical protein
MKDLINMIFSCFIRDNIIFVEDLNTIKTSVDIPTYKLKSETIISIDNLDNYANNLVEVQPENTYHIFNIHH